MNCRRQALQLCLNLAVVVVIEILYEFLFAVLHGLRLLQIQQFTLEQTKETLNHGIAQTVVSRVMRKIVYGSGRNLLQGAVTTPWLLFSRQGAKGQGRRYAARLALDHL